MTWPQASDTTSATAQTLISRLVEALGIEQTVVIQKAMEAVLVLVIAWVALRIAKTVTTRVQRRFTPDEGEPVDESDQRARTVAQILYSMFVVITSGAAALTVLNLFIPIGPLLAGVGVLGLAVSFGAQNLAAVVPRGGPQFSGRPPGASESPRRVHTTVAEGPGGE